MGVLERLSQLDPSTMIAKAIDEKARKVLDCENYVKPIVEEVDPPTNHLPIAKVPKERRKKYPTEHWLVVNTGLNRKARRDWKRDDQEAMVKRQHLNEARLDRKRAQRKRVA